MRLFFLLVFIMLPNLLFAQADNLKGEGRNPFFTLKEQKQGFAVSAIEEKEAPTVLFLQGIFIWPDKKVALINGQILKEGDSIKTYRVTAIYEDKVVVEGASGQTALNLPGVRK